LNTSNIRFTIKAATQQCRYSIVTNFPLNFFQLRQCKLVLNRTLVQNSTIEDFQIRREYAKFLMPENGNEFLFISQAKEKNSYFLSNKQSLGFIEIE
jgi:hypothetical protein